MKNSDCVNCRELSRATPLALEGGSEAPHAVDGCRLNLESRISLPALFLTAPAHFTTFYGFISR